MYNDTANDGPGGPSFAHFIDHCHLRTDIKERD